MSPLLISMPAHRYTEKHDLLSYFNVPAYEVADLFIHPDDAKTLQKVCEKYVSRL